MANFTTKTWVNRDVEYPGRRTASLVSGTTSTYDYSRTEGTVYEEGDLPDATTMNDLEDRIDESVTSLETNRAVMGGGLLINGNFSINQLSLIGTVTLSAYEYGHDGWGAGASGCTYTFSKSAGITTITISAGTLRQKIEADNVQSGLHVLSWTGTAQGRIDSGSYGDSGLTGTLTGGTYCVVEFGTGTVSLAKLEKGNTATNYLLKSKKQNLEDCQRYFWVGEVDGNGSGYQYSTASANPILAGSCSFPVKMRIEPTMLIVTAPTYVGCTNFDLQASQDGFCQRVAVSASGQYRAVYGVYSADARLSLS